MAEKSAEEGADVTTTLDQEGYRLHAWDTPLTWDRFPRPTPRTREVLVEVESCGVGLTVLNYLRGDLAKSGDHLPVVPGHELVGRVVALGDGCDPELLEQRITAYFYLSCGRCRHCIAGWHPRCSALAGHVGVDRDGGYAPYVALPELNVIPLPAGLDPVDATVVADATATPVHICGSRAHIGPGDRVAVLGAGGGVGAHLVQVVRVYGAEVVGIDVTPEKLELVEGLGVRAVAAGDLPHTSADTLFDTGAPTAIMDLVGANDTLRWALDSVGTGGRVVVVTTFRDRGVDLSPRPMVLGETAVRASRYARRDELVTAADLVRRGDVSPVIGSTVRPREVEQLHDMLRDGKLLGRGAIDWRATT